MTPNGLSTYWEGDWAAGRAKAYGVSVEDLPAHYAKRTLLGEEVLARLYAGKGFFSARGLNLQQGLSESNIQEAQLKALMIRHTKQVIAVVDSTKLGQTSFSSFCPFSRIDHLITAGDGAQERAVPFVENGLAISIV